MIGRRRIAFASRGRADNVIAAGKGGRIAGRKGVLHLGVDLLFLGLKLFVGGVMLRHFLVRLLTLCGRVHGVTPMSWLSWSRRKDGGTAQSGRKKSGRWRSGNSAGAARSESGSRTAARSAVES